MKRRRGKFTVNQVVGPREDRRRLILALSHVKIEPSREVIKERQKSSATTFFKTFLSQWKFSCGRIILVLMGKFLEHRHTLTSSGQEYPFCEWTESRNATISWTCTSQINLTDKVESLCSKLEVSLVEVISPPVKIYSSVLLFHPIFG